MAQRRTRRRGLTLVELAVSAALLAMVVAPILGSISRAAELSTTIERQTRSMLLAQQVLEDAIARTQADFAADMGRTAVGGGDGCLANLVQAAGGLTKQLTAEAGWDSDGDGALSSGEVMVTLVTEVADTGG